MCESIGVELAAVVVEPAVFGWVAVEDGKMHSGGKVKTLRTRRIVKRAPDKAIAASSKPVAAVNSARSAGILLKFRAEKPCAVGSDARHLLRVARPQPTAI